MWRRRVVALAGSAAMVVASSSCGPSVSGSPHAAGTSDPPRSAASAAPTAPPPTVPATTTTLAPPVPLPGWEAVRTTPSAVAVQKRSVTTGDGSIVTLVLFKAGTYRLALHAGSTDPPTGGVPLPADGQSAVGAAERPLLVGAFNGGFKTSTGSGGVEIDGHALVALHAGLASIVIDANGQAEVGVYGQTVPAPGHPAVSVRQNLGLLVQGGALAPGIGNVPSWGATIGGRSAVARSAVGQDAAGDLIVAGSMSALPADIGTALIEGGATTAMEMDINPAWVQLDLAATPGGALTAAIPGQYRPASQYLDGWTRDFFTVLASS